MQEMEEQIEKQTQHIINTHRQTWEAEMDAMIDLMRQEWQDAQDKRHAEAKEQHEREKEEALAQAKLELEAKESLDDHQTRQDYWRRRFKDVARANHQGEMAVLESVDQEKQRAIGRLCHGARELDSVFTKCGNQVMKRMQKGSFFAEKEYGRVLKWEAKVKGAQARHHQIVKEVVDGIAQLALISHTFVPTDGVIR